ncbi:MAG: hypothetical protein ACLQNE_31995 [Thermoguttaceae bacterium]
MKTEPYIPLAQRQLAFWTKVSDILGIPPDDAREVYIQCWCSGMDSKDFLRCLETGRLTKEQVLERAQHMKPKSPQGETDERSAVIDDIIDEIHQEIDEENYRLKQIIEVGDEVLAGENKRFLTSGEYITAGKWYVVQHLHDQEGMTDFAVVTSTNIPGENNWENQFSIKVLRRQGQVIWRR